MTPISIIILQDQRTVGAQGAVSRLAGRNVKGGSPLFKEGPTFFSIIITYHHQYDYYS